MQQGIRFAALAVALAGGASAAQAVTFTGVYTENFNTLGTTPSAVNTTLPAGFTITESNPGTGTPSARIDGGYYADNGASTTGDTYSYGTTGSSDRALGTLRSGTITTVIDGLFTNGNSAAVTGVTIAYTGEQWRLGTTGRADTLQFSYSTNGTTYTTLAALTFTSPFTTTAGALDGNAAANRTLLTGTITGLNIASGSSLFLRWTDLDATGGDDGLAIDDFSLTPTLAAAVPEPATWAMMMGGLGLLGGAMRRRRTSAASFA